MGLHFDDDYPEILQIIAYATHAFMIKEGKLPPEMAADISMRCAEAVRDQIGGLRNYIPKGVKHQSSKRARQIYREFNGRNHAQLARKYKLTDERIRQIVKQLGDEEFQRRQPKLL